MIAASNTTLLTSAIVSSEFLLNFGSYFYQFFAKFARSCRSSGLITTHYTLPELWSENPLKDLKHQHQCSCTK